MELVASKITEKAIELIVTKLVEKIISSAWNADNESGREIINHFTDADICRNYSDKYVSRFLKIRTLHSAESDVFLDEIYTPLDITDKKTKKSITINEQYSVSEYSSLNIVGIAGQGKSLRYPQKWCR